MGVNSTEVAYGFGQLGSVYTTASSDAVKPPTNKVLVAVQMLSYTIFDDTGGLIAEQRVNNTITTSVKNNVYIGTEAAANDLADGSETVDEGSGVTLVGNMVVSAQDLAQDAFTSGVGRFRVTRATATRVTMSRIG